MIHITYDGPIVAWQRTGLNKGKKHYTRDETRDMQNALAMAAINQVGRPMLTGAIGIEIKVYFEPPGSWSAVKRHRAIHGIDGVMHTVKPDYDNLAKTIGDALNGIVWKDDAQIVDAHIRKLYSSRPGLALRVFELKNPLK